MTLDEAIEERLKVIKLQEKLYEECCSDASKEIIKSATDNDRQLVEWLMELKQWHRVYGVCPSYEMCIPECKEGYNAQIAEYKRLLKAAVEDFESIGEVNSAPTPMLHPKYGEYLKAIDIHTRRWRYADEALKLIGND